MGRVEPTPSCGHFFARPKCEKMYLRRLSILNYKNICDAEVELSEGLNCFVGINGAGKTNVLDAVYYLSMCKSALGSTDPGSLNKNVDAEFFMLTGNYLTDEGGTEEVVCSYKKGGSNKSVRRAGKEYERLSDHVGLVPVVIVSPQDIFLINDAAEERRRWLNSFISQFDREYMAALIKYNRVLAERNTMLKVADGMGCGELLDVVDEQLSYYGKKIHARRAEIIAGLAEKVEKYYAIISGERESVSLSYRSELNEAELGDLLRANRERDLLNRHTGSGVHRDDVIMKIGGQMLKRFGSQGQQKSFLVALKLAQYDDIASRMKERPLLLLDDLFDKLDNDRLGHLMSLTADGSFGQTLISDCNEERLRAVLDSRGVPYKLFYVDGGEVKEKRDEEV